jgi:hypothetical protein
MQRVSETLLAIFWNTFMAVLFHRFFLMGTYVLVSNFADRVGDGRTTGIKKENEMEKNNCQFVFFATSFGQDKTQFFLYLIEN